MLSLQTRWRVCELGGELANLVVSLQSRGEFANMVAQCLVCIHSGELANSVVSLQTRQ